MNVVQFAALVVVGFVGPAEFGSYAFVHPVVRALPRRYHLQVEQGLLKTFGRVMPFGMTAAPVLAVSVALDADGSTAVAGWFASAFLVAALVVTIIVNVPLNLQTGRWDLDEPPSDWKAKRNRWERGQAVRSWLLLAGFVALAVAATID